MKKIQEETVSKQDKEKYFSDMRGLERTVFEEILTSRNRAWKFSFFLGLLSLISLLIVGYVVHKYSEPITEHILTINKDTGEAQELSLLKDTKSYGEVVDKYWLSQYVTHHEAYDFYSIQMDYDAIGLMSSRAVADEYSKKFMGADRLDQKYGDTIVVSVKVRSVILDEKKQQAEVRFTTQVHHRVNDTYDPPKNFIATIGFEYVKRTMTASQRYINPLGFRVLAYRVVEEVEGSSK